MLGDGLATPPNLELTLVLAQSKNLWIPYDETCPTSKLMETLVVDLAEMRNKSKGSRHRGPLRSHDSSRPSSQSEDTSKHALPWLVNATILMQGACSRPGWPSSA